MDFERQHFQHYTRIHVGKAVYYRTNLEVAIVSDDDSEGGDDVDCNALALQVRFSGKKIGGGITICSTARSIIICTWDMTTDQSQNQRSCDDLTVAFSRFVIASEFDEQAALERKIQQVGGVESLKTQLQAFGLSTEGEIKELRMRIFQAVFWGDVQLETQRKGGKDSRKDRKGTLKTKATCR